MKKIFLSFLLTIFIATPVASLAATKSVTIEWSMPSTFEANVTGYNMYYSYDTTPPNADSPIPNCNNWEEISTDNFRMTCPTVTIEQYPVYFFIGAVTSSGEIILSNYDKKEILQVQNFQIITTSESTDTAITTSATTFYSTLDSLSSLVSPTIGTGGTATADVTFTTGSNGNAITKAAASTSGFEIPASNLKTDSFTIEFDFIASHDNNNSVYEGLVNMLSINYGTPSSLRLRAGNGGGTDWAWSVDLYDDALAKHSLSSGFSSNLRFSAGDILHIEIIVNANDGTLVILVNDAEVASATGSPFPMNALWGRSSSSTLKFFKEGVHSSKIDELKLL
ncbi:hypothetical protein C4565_10575 [Candidatus Parcubacteria bacterium]|nr:MAG: hypothetical protein C4565_10575 [Candidatus Parcubacteria bacterium]